MCNEKFSSVRKRFPVAERYAYLDTASSGLLSRDTYKVITNYVADRYEDGAGITEYCANWAFTDGLRALVAETLNAQPEEIFFADNSSTILNIFSEGVLLKENANVVTTSLTFPSTPYSWINRLGSMDRVRIAPAENGQVSYETLISLVDENTAAICLCMVENTSGFCHDVRKIGEFCKERGIYFVLDATQAMGAMKIDVKEMHVDFIATSTFKWMNNVFGVGVGYISRRIIDQVKPPYVGWAGNKNRMDHSRLELRLEESACKFEMGGHNWLGLRGLEQSVKMYLWLGIDEVEKYILSLTAYLYSRITQSEFIGLIGPFPEKNRSGITYLTFPTEWELNDAILKEHGIRAHVTGPGSIRIAVHYFNNLEDVDRLMDYLDGYGKKKA